MKTILSFLILSFTINAQAQNLLSDLSHKTCSINILKPITLTENDPHKRIGQLYLMPLIEEQDFNLQAGPANLLEFDEQVLTFSERKNLAFICVVDDKTECISLAEVKSSDLREISDEYLDIICE